MSKVRNHASASKQVDTGNPLDRLSAAVEAVAAHLEIIGHCLDEIREDLQWALRNGQVNCPCPADPLSEVPPPSYRSQRSGTAEDDEEIAEPESTEQTPPENGVADRTPSEEGERPLRPQ